MSQPDALSITLSRHHGLEVFSAGQASDAPPLLFVHGAFAGGWMWCDTYLPFFAGHGFECHALSLRGHGNSAGRDSIDWHSIQDYVDDVWSLAQSFSRPPILIGHSMGGFVVQKYLEKHDATGGALLCSVPPQGLVAAQFHLLFQKPHLFMEINSLMSGHQTDARTLREALFAGPVPEHLLHTWLHQMQPESHRALWDMSMFCLPNLRAKPHPPMFIMGAEHDALVPFFLVQSTAHTYGLPVTLLREMGHAITHETNWVNGAERLLQWIRTIR